MKIINFYEGHIYECLYFLALSPFPGPDPSPGPQFVFTGPGPQFVFTGPGPQFAFTGPGPQFVFTSHGPNLYLLALAYNFITSPSLSLHITAMSPQFVSVFMALAYHLFYRSGLINNTSICMPILVN